MKRVSALCLVLAACAGEPDASPGTSECASWSDASCPAECTQVRERRLDVAGACMRSAPIACTTERAGRTMTSGCCVRDDGAVFRTSHGGPLCPYRAPQYVAFRDCTDAEQSALPDDDCS